MQEFKSNLSDFYLAKAGPTRDQTYVSTQVMGTQGYAAPEYVAIGATTAYMITLSFLYCLYMSNFLNYPDNMHLYCELFVKDWPEIDSFSNVN